MKGILKIKATGQRLERLTEMYNHLLGTYIPETDHEHLLYECAMVFYGKLEKLAEKEQMNYTISVQGWEALAFTQLWKSKPVLLPPYLAVVVNETIGKIDRTHKSVIR